MKNKVAMIFTLGCRLNAADTSLLHSRLEECDYRLAEADASMPFDLAVINSCAITAEAGRKSLQLLRKLRKSRPDALIVFTGCAAELAPEKFRNAGADIVTGNPGKKDLAALLSGKGTGETADERMRLSCEEIKDRDFRENAMSAFPFRSRAFIKIQEGCNNFCTYCIVPTVRGPERSRDFDEVMCDCRQAIELGYPEIVLTGVNTCAYNSHGRDLPALLRELKEIPGSWRLRLSSTEPHPNNLSLLDTMAECGTRVCRFLHLSLQHGSDRILKAMNRHYSTEEFASFVKTAREKLPGIHIGTDIIIGFPGETDEDFAESCAFIEKMQFANIHIFTYSPRPGTPAASMPGQVGKETAKRRYVMLKKIADASKERFIAENRGKMLPVIFEEEQPDGTYSGWSDNYIHFISSPSEKTAPGKIILRELK